MMASDFIVDVTDSDFDYQVLAYSQQIPVVVDFWAEWCAPCRVLGPILERLAQEGQGSFRLAKVNVDENPNLARRYFIRSIPAVKAFRDGKLVSEFLGALPEPKVRDFIRAIAPSQAELNIEKGNSFLEAQKPRQAESVFRQALQELPDQPKALLGLAKSLLLQGEGEEALAILQNFPPSREYNSAEILRPLALALSRYQRGEIEDDLAWNADPLQAAFNNAIRLVARGNIEAALDGLLDILRQDKNYRHGEVRRLILALLECLGESEISRQYRQELASVLF